MPSCGNTVPAEVAQTPRPAGVGIGIDATMASAGAFDLLTKVSLETPSIRRIRRIRRMRPIGPQTHRSCPHGI